MPALSKIKSLLPASSRSLHGMYKEIVQMHGQLGEIQAYLGKMHGHMGEMWGEVGQTRIRLENVERFLHQFQADEQSREQSHDARMMMLLWEACRAEGETIADTKRRVTTNLPAATGNMRLYQLAAAQLLFEFDAFCREHGLCYWLQSGTLLGAVRHKGFIPWDDDLDVAMCRNDIERAIQLVADDPRYEITVRYDWYVNCRQMRFRYADERIPCFVDLFAFDLVTAVDKQAFVTREAERAALEADLAADESLAAYWNAGAQFVDDDTEEGQLVRVHFDRHLQELKDKGLLASSLDEAEGVVWAIDNVNSGVRHHSWYFLPKEAVWPLATMPFEGHDVSVPADAERCLTDIFGDIYELPHTVGSYFDHLLGDALDDQDTRAALAELAARSDA